MSRALAQAGDKAQGEGGMTCIVGLKADDGVWIGADRAVTDGWQVSRLAAPKLARLDDRMLLGGAGSLRALQAIQYGFRLPRRHTDDDLLGWLVTDVVPAWATRLRDAKVVKASEGVETVNLCALAGIEGRLFEIGTGGAVCELDADFYAGGSGREYALGAMHATASTGMAPRERIIAALEAAAAYDAPVSGPFDVEFIGKAGEREPASAKGKAA